MKSKRLITVFLFIIVVSSALAARVYYFDNSIDIASLSFDTRFVGERGIDTSGLFSNGITLETVYLFGLSLSGMVFGNSVVAGLYLNVLLQVITIMLVFLALNKAVNRYVGFVVGIIAALLPVYLGFLADFSGVNLLGPICGAVLVLAAFLVRVLFRKKNKGDLGMKEIRLDEIERTDEIEETEEVEGTDEIEETEEVEQTEVKKINYIENPLPVPKRREHKQMDYAVPIGENDDYDIKDMTGRDFFDIE